MKRISRKIKNKPERIRLLLCCNAGNLLLCCGCPFKVADHLPVTVAMAYYKCCEGDNYKGLQGKNYIQKSKHQ